MSGRGDEDDRYADLEKRIDELERFRSWLTGGLAVLGIVGAFLAEKIRKLLGLG